MHVAVSKRKIVFIRGLTKAYSPQRIMNTLILLSNLSLALCAIVPHYDLELVQDLTYGLVESALQRFDQGSRLAAAQNNLAKFGVSFWDSAENLVNTVFTRRVDVAIDEFSKEHNGLVPYADIQLAILSHMDEDQVWGELFSL